MTVLVPLSTHRSSAARTRCVMLFMVVMSRQ